jgi:hypothetical protein
MRATTIPGPMRLPTLTQAEWAIGTVKKNIERFENQSEDTDFIAFLGKRYAPVGAKNDPEGLNQNWVKNVRYWYEAFLYYEE